MRIRQHVNPNREFFRDLHDTVPQIDPIRPLEIEIGCADAQFLFQRAERFPDHQFFGLEIRDKWVKWVNREANSRKLPVRAIFCHANLHLPRLFAPGSIDTAYINFPDPWFKTKHHERRMLDDSLIAALLPCMKPGGHILIQTDVWDLALDGLAAMEAFDGDLANLAGPWSFWKKSQPFDAKSWRETHCETSGRPIWRLFYQKNRDNKSVVKA